MQINIQTVKFMKMLDELAELTNDDFTEFEDLTQEQIEYECGIIYDKNNRNKNGGYKVVLDLLIDGEHHDIVSYFESYCDCSGYTVSVMEDEENSDDKWIQVDIDDECIVIERGQWYFA